MAQPPTPAQFTTAQVQSTEQTAQEEQARIAALEAAMAGQAGQLVSAWGDLFAMMHKAGTPDSTKSSTSSSTTTSGNSNSAGEGINIAATGAPLIKAGTIIFAVLDTTANSDYPDSPVMATVVDGPFKGAKLLGKLAIRSL